ncbi:GGDEF domain-containing protein [Lentzea sp. NBRC 105346]|uniref:GGDEF domain-containing protein n=1 Tax=Lentzea sp. NBRC 105346 TaxID=3032205 RepID=UPI00255653F3|nr:GGDEF domain-containing protein [Lentzea sp. NBRC 105346]
MLTHWPLPSKIDIIRATGLAFAMVVHLVAVRRAEESRRDAAQGPHIMLTSVWTFAAVVALPPSLAIAQIVLVRLMMLQIARRSPHRYVFTTVSMLVSALTASGIIWWANTWPHAHHDWYTDVTFFTLILSAGAVYGALQAVMVGLAMKLTLPDRAFKSTLGSRSENLLDVITLTGGAVIGLLMVVHWAAPLLALFPMIAINKMLEEARQRNAHMERLLREQRQAHQQLIKDSHTDFRTGLLNTTGLAEYAGRLVNRCMTDNQPVTVLVIDLDHFKRINDTWGHPAGNAVLAEVGRILRDKLRPGDVAARDGGEEFVVALAETGLAQGVAIAERIREAIGELAVLTTDKHRNTVTLYGRELPAPDDSDVDLRAISSSIGLAVIPDNGDSLAAAQHSADAALYKAKENGRNQVRVAGLDIPPRLMPAPRHDDITKPITTRSA